MLSKGAMDDKMKKNVSLIVAALLLFCLVSSMFHFEAAEADVGTPIAGDGSEKTSNLPKASVDGHKMTSSELYSLKNRIGDYVEGQNYNQLVGGHGTGLRPPSEQAWADIAQNSYSVDLVSYPGNPPSSVDESTKPWFPPIGNQGQQGSCVAWSVGYYVKTFQEAQEHGWNVSAARWLGGYPGYPTQNYQSKIISPAFIYNLQNGGVDMGLSFYSAINLICSVGECSWKEMPYNQTDYTTWPTEPAWTEAPLYRGNSSGYQWMDLSTDQGLTNLKNWIASDHLVTIGVDANKYYSNFISGDFWTLDNYDNPSVNHANTIVGYDDNIAYNESGVTHYGAFKIANSWGVGGWEKVPDGFFWVSYEAMKQRIGYCMFYYDLISYNPSLTATFSINHTKRSECSIVIGMGNPSAPLATKSFSQYIDGGSLPFCQNNILLDITEFKNYVPSVYNQSYFLRVYDGGTSTTGTVTSFAVNNAPSSNAPCQTLNGGYVYLNVFLPLPINLIGTTSWYWTSATSINVVKYGDTNSDSRTEIVTGGTYFDGTRTVAQLIVWNSSSFAAEKLTAWYWTGNTTINSLALGDVDGDGKTEIVTSGSFFDGTRNVAQLVVWNATSLLAEEITAWYWTNNTVVNSVTLGDVDGDGQVEIVTGGYFNDGSRNVAQLVVWTGSTLAVDKLMGWYWTGNTVINSVSLGDVDGDGQVEIVTGGYYNDGSRNVAQLIEWNGATLAVDRLTAWYWTGNTVINSVALGDADNDGQTEVVTGGYYNDGVRNIAQLIEWNGANLAVDRLTGWYWTSNTVINSVALGDVDNDGQNEIVTGGQFNDGIRDSSQLVMWSGSNLIAEQIKGWYWTGNTTINSVVVGDVNGGSSSEILTGGTFHDGTRQNSQLTVWGTI
jgi:hypothetical protein